MESPFECAAGLMTPTGPQGWWEMCAKVLAFVRMRALRSMAFDGLWVLWTALFGLAIPVLLSLGSPPGAVRRLTRLWVRGILLLLSGVVGLKYALQGWEHVLNTPTLIIANHQSTWETLAALVLFPDVAIVAKRELLRIPVMGWYLKHSPMIVIDRDEASKALRLMTAQSRAAVAAGRSVLIFPEGTRKPVGDLVEFKRGVELLYRTLGVPVLPVVVNSGCYWPLGRALKRPGIITVSCLAPIQPGLSAAIFTKTAEGTIQARKAILESAAEQVEPDCHTVEPPFIAFVADAGQGDRLGKERKLNPASAHDRPSAKRGTWRDTSATLSAAMAKAPGMANWRARAAAAARQYGWRWSLRR